MTLLRKWQLTWRLVPRDAFTVWDLRNGLILLSGLKNMKPENALLCFNPDFIESNWEKLLYLPNQKKLLCVISGFFDRNRLKFLYPSSNHLILIFPNKNGGSNLTWLLEIYYKESQHKRNFLHFWKPNFSHEIERGLPTLYVNCTRLRETWPLNFLFFHLLFFTSKLDVELIFETEIPRKYLYWFRDQVYNWDYPSMDYYSMVSAKLCVKI